MEILIAIVFFGYVFYLRNYAKLQMPADNDIEASTHSPETRVKNGPFVDRKLIVSMTMVVLTSALLVSVIKRSEGIHVPYLVAVFSAISIGFAEPYKGWLLAVIQCILILAGYHFFTEIPGNGGRREMENFGLYGSAVLTFAASFLGAFLKKALSMK